MSGSWLGARDHGNCILQNGDEKASRVAVTRSEYRQYDSFLMGIIEVEPQMEKLLKLHIASHEIRAFNLAWGKG